MPDVKGLELRIPEDQYRLISELSDINGKTVNSTCINILGRFFEHSKVIATDKEVRKRLKLRIPENLYHLISRLADKKGKTINSMCIDIFGQFFEDCEPRRQ